MLTLWITIMVFNAVAVFMKKKLAAFVYYGAIYFALFCAMMTDKLTDKYDTYSFFEPGIIDAKELLVIFGVYPAATMMIANWFPYQKSWLYKICYIIGWSVFSVFYQWLAIASGFFHQQNWKLWYSALLYPFIYAVLILNVYFILWLIRREKKPHPEL